ncbi:MAG: Rne/Rng family ribonuclease, partial [Deltaproteobacteria bacterium]|nr:Rne/Rng family ribonuclease [Deltaproteobacteria bacterium]
MTEKLMVIDAGGRNEVTVALLEDSLLWDIFTDYDDSRSLVGNIHYGVVTGIDRGLQAAFVDIGTSRNAFLQISDVHPRYGKTGKEILSLSERNYYSRDRIENILKPGQKILVQVTRDSIETKGCTVTTFISIPGRLSVLLPWMEGSGISQKIADDELRSSLKSTLKKAMKGINGLSEAVILRTQGQQSSRAELEKDIRYSKRLWDVIFNYHLQSEAPELIYDDSDIIIRILRDYITSDYSKIILDSKKSAEKVSTFLRLLMPRKAPELYIYNGKVPILHAFGIDAQLGGLSDIRVGLPSGGYLYIEKTHALVSIDVNSGKGSSSISHSENVLRTNTEAIKEISRQLKLRDLGGIIVLDLITMSNPEHRRNCERLMRELLKDHKEKHNIGRIDEFGLMIISRQRTRHSMEAVLTRECSVCNGTGKLKRTNILAREVIRQIQWYQTVKNSYTVKIEITPELLGEVIKLAPGIFVKTGSCRIDINVVSGEKESYSVELLDRNGRKLNTDNFVSDKTSVELYSQNSKFNKGKGGSRKRGEKSGTAKDTDTEKSHMKKSDDVDTKISKSSVGMDTGKTSPDKIIGEIKLNHNNSNTPVVTDEIKSDSGKTEKNQYEQKDVSGRIEKKIPENDLFNEGNSSLKSEENSTSENQVKRNSSKRRGRYRKYSEKKMSEKESDSVSAKEVNENKKVDKTLPDKVQPDEKLYNEEKHSVSNVSKRRGRYRKSVAKPVNTLKEVEKQKERPIAVKSSPEKSREKPRQQAEKEV